MPALIRSCSAFEPLIRTSVRCRPCRIRPSGIALCAPRYLIHPLVEHRTSAPRAAPSIRPLSGAICALLSHPRVERRPLRPATPSIRSANSATCAPGYPIRVSNGAICALLSHPLCEFALDGGVLLLGNGKLAAVLQGHLAAGHVAHKSGVDQVACMAANKEVAVALGDRGERFD